MGHQLLKRKTGCIIAGAAAEPDADVDVDGRDPGVWDPGFTARRARAESDDDSSCYQQRAATAAGNSGNHGSISRYNQKMTS